MSYLNPPFILSMLLALSVHEWAHGFVAYHLGDPTAKYEGRLTLNPLAHLDPIGTIMFVIVGFGWGKPVPINPRYFKHYRRDTALVSLAGPASNLILAFTAFFLLLLLSPASVGSVGTGLAGSGAVISFIAEFLQASLFLNLGLMAFNLLPVAPLDGSKILQTFIPLRYEDLYDQYMRYGPYILLFLIIAGRTMGGGILSAWINFIISPVLQVMDAIAGRF